MTRNKGIRVESIVAYMGLVLYLFLLVTHHLQRWMKVEYNKAPADVAIHLHYLKEGMYPSHHPGLVLMVSIQYFSKLKEGHDLRISHVLHLGS